MRAASRSPFAPNAPAKWETVRIDRMFKARRDLPREDDQLVSAFIDGQVTARSNRPGSIIKNSGMEHGYKRIRKGDLAISGMNAHLGGLGISDSDGKCSPVYLVLRPVVPIDSGFCSYLLRHMAMSGYIRSLVQTIRFNSSDFKFEDLKNLYLPMPSVSEQKAIADYLDRETARIDSLINKKRQMIELLELKLECEALQITQDKGKAESLRRSLNRIQTGTTPSEEFFSFDDNYDSIPWITPGDFTARLSAVSISKSLRVDAVTSGVIKIHPKDSVLVVGIGATAGRVSMADRSVTSNQQITGLVCSARLLPRFLAWQLWARRNEVLDTAPYTTLPILNNEFLKSLMVFVPSLEEQETVATRLDRLASRIGATKQGLDTQIARFIELRQALITAAVTGELEIPEAAA